MSTSSNGRSGSELYDEEYYDHHLDHVKPHPYRHGDPEWEAHFARISTEIIRSLKPRRVFDAGCAIGFLVEALWDRGVEAHGRDISEFAISQVRPDVRVHCHAGSLTDPIEGHYDLITCLEVLEHLEASDAELAVKHLTAAADSILFSSSPSDFLEPTHINVRPPLYWVRLFADEGFEPVLSFDATFVSPWAMVFRRASGPVPDDTVSGYADLIRLRVELDEVTQERNGLNIRLASALQGQYRAEAELLEMRGTQADLVHHRALLTQRDLELNHLRVRTAELDARIHSIESSIFWRSTGPARRLVGALPPSLRRRAKAALRGLARVVNLRFLRRPAPVVPAAEPVGPSAQPPVEGEPAVKLAERYPFLEPLRVFRSPDERPVVRVYTDSVSPGSLFGGVATALVLGARMATRMGCSMDVVTRTEPGDAAAVVKLLSSCAVPIDGLTVGTTFVGDGGGSAVPIGRNDIIIATSWWTADLAGTAIGYDRLVYLLQEDERLFYPRGDEFLRCAEVLNDPRIKLVVNTGMLHRHFTQGPDPLRHIEGRSVHFEPAFPEKLFRDDPAARDHSGKRTFAFYARPRNFRNLYWRGMEAIERAILEGLIDPEQWRFLFLGKDLPDLELPGRPEIVVGQNLTLAEYATYIRQAHVGLSLIYSPHPSYPPLDLAASGAVVVTNRFHPSKVDLSEFSENIICAEPNVDDLTGAIGRAVELAADEPQRLDHYLRAGLRRDWATTFEPVLDQLDSWFTG